jgi:hypothetical protein
MPQPPDNPNLDSLVELANREGVDIRPTLLRVTTDLYVQKPRHSADEDRHFTELALRLFDLVDAPTRAIVAEKIARYANAPAVLRRRALRDHAGVHKLPGDTYSAPDAFAIGTAIALELAELFFAASVEERRLILANLPYGSLAPARSVAAPLAHAAIERLEAAALAHNGESFVRAIEGALGISPALARRVCDDSSGEPIVVAAVALAMPASVLQRILLCLNASISQSVQRVYDLALLHEELAPEAALRLLAIWRASGSAPGIDLESGSQADRPPSALTLPRSVATAPARRFPLPERPNIPWARHVKSNKERA